MGTDRFRSCKDPTLLIPVGTFNDEYTRRVCVCTNISRINHKEKRRKKKLKRESKGHKLK